MWLSLSLSLPLSLSLSVPLSVSLYLSLSLSSWFYGKRWLLEVLWGPNWCQGWKWYQDTKQLPYLLFSLSSPFSSSLLFGLGASLSSAQRTTGCQVCNPGQPYAKQVLYLLFYFFVPFLDSSCENLIRYCLLGKWYSLGKITCEKTVWRLGTAEIKSRYIFFSDSVQWYSAL